MSWWIINPLVWQIKINLLLSRKVSSIVFPINSRSSIYINSQIFIILIRDIGIWSNFVKSRRLDPSQNTDKASRTIFLPTETLFISWFPWEGESWNICLGDLEMPLSVLQWDLLLLRTLLLVLSLPPWGDSMEETGSRVLDWSDWYFPYQEAMNLASLEFNLPFYCLSGEHEEFSSSCSTWHCYMHDPQELWFVLIPPTDCGNQTRLDWSFPWCPLLITFLQSFQSFIALHFFIFFCSVRLFFMNLSNCLG